MPNPPTPSFHLKLPQELRDWIRGEAFRQDIPMAEVIRRTLEKERERAQKAMS